jgi:hypothetical protein
MYEYTVISMNVRMHYEHLQETESAQYLEIDEVSIDTFVVDGNVSSH